MPSVLHTLLLIASAYALGSLSGSLLLGRLRGVDIRSLGSGNAGGANAFRTQGVKFACAVVVVDVGKGVLAAWLGVRYAPLAAGYADATVHGYAAAFAAVLGHVWPLWHGFRGGKGAATLAGGVLVLWPWVTPLLIAVWLGTILVSGYAGLATLLAGLSLALAAWWSEAAAPRLWFACAAALLLLFTHRGNLARLLRGEESRFRRARLMHRLWRPRG
ncbi:MAG: glycerol-3-phosphate 1-O-acyltransferase PlsY [Luteimonas sp.]